MALAVGPIPPEAESTRGWKHQYSTSLWLIVNYLMKVTGTQCSPMYPMWISCSLPGKRSSLRLWKFVSPRNDFPEKASPFHHCLVQWRRRKSPFRSFKHTGSVNGFQEYKRQRNLGTTAIGHTKTSFLNHLHHAEHTKLSILFDIHLSLVTVLKPRSFFICP